MPSFAHSICRVSLPAGTLHPDATGRNEPREQRILQPIMVEKRLPL